MFVILFCYFYFYFHWSGAAVGTNIDNIGVKPVVIDNNESKPIERSQIDNGMRSNYGPANNASTKYGAANNASANNASAIYGSAVNSNNNNDNDNASRLPGHTKGPPASVRSPCFTFEFSQGSHLSSLFHSSTLSGVTSELALSLVHTFRGHLSARRARGTTALEQALEARRTRGGTRRRRRRRGCSST